jgi:hypothetical protein
MRETVTFDHFLTGTGVTLIVVLWLSGIFLAAWLYEWARWWTSLLALALAVLLFGLLSGAMIAAFEPT